MPHRTRKRSLSRRESAAIPALLAGAAATPFAQRAPLTAGQVVDRIKQNQGMRLCADWLRWFVPEVPVEWIPAGDPFWRP